MCPGLTHNVTIDCQQWSSQFNLSYLGVPRQRYVIGLLYILEEFPNSPVSIPVLEVVQPIMDSLHSHEKCYDKADLPDSLNFWYFPYSFYSFTV